MVVYPHVYTLLGGGATKLLTARRTRTAERVPGYFFDILYPVRLGRVPNLEYSDHFTKRDAL